MKNFFTPCGYLFYGMVKCFYTFGRLFLYCTILNQNASLISQTDSQILYFSTHKCPILNRSVRFVLQIIPSRLLKAW